MGDISCIGLGLMGSALAETLVRAGHNVTVWNRSPSKAKLLIDLGATRAEHFRDAIEANQTILICIDNYTSTNNLFCADDVARLLKGRTVIQLSTGTPSEARLAYEWFSRCGAEYLDGGILGGPAAIGSPRVQIIYSGSHEAFSRSKTMLAALGERSRYISAEPGAASTVDLAWLANRFGNYLSAAYGAMLCEADGVDLDVFINVFGTDEPARWIVEVIRNNAFEKPTATLGVCNASLRMIQRHAREQKVDSSFPDFVVAILDRAEEAGLGSEHIAAMVKIIRLGNEPTNRT